MNAPTVTEGMVTMPKDEFEELLERVAERGARLGLGKRAFERRREDDLDLVAHPPLGEERVHQEEELQRRHRALDGHLGDVDHQATAGPAGQPVAQGVKIGDRAHDSFLDEKGAALLRTAHLGQAAA
mgnify:CR=1 FL=1